MKKNKLLPINIIVFEFTSPNDPIWRLNIKRSLKREWPVMYKAIKALSKQHGKKSSRLDNRL